MENLIVFAESQYKTAVLQLKVAKELLDNIRSNSSTSAEIKANDTDLHWVYIDKLSELTGLSKNGIRNRIARKIWKKGIHYRNETTQAKSRLLFNLKEINKLLSNSL
jgi:hypothetical protein